MASVFKELCAALARSLTPALISAGFAAPSEPFSTSVVRYDFRRAASAGTQTYSVLFNRSRQPQFSVQLFVEPRDGLGDLQLRGGTLVIGGLSSLPPRWPLGVRPFRAHATAIQSLLRLQSPSPATAVQSALALMPEVEQWWESQRSSKNILASKLVFPARSHEA